MRKRQVDRFVPPADWPGPGKMHTPHLFREMRLEVEAPRKREDGSEDPRIAIALSSESPVERFDWWTGERYFEVLDHSQGAVDLSRAEEGLPFLLDHSARAQIGIIEEIRLDQDRKLRGMVRMGNHPDAGWVEKDMRSGIRTKISVGYDPGEQYEATKEKEGKIPTRTYRGWTPYEGSSVAIPADMTVGIDRTAVPAAPIPESTPATGRKPEERRMPEEIQTPATPPTGGGPSAAEQRERDVRTLGQYAAEFPEARELLPTWLERGVGPSQALKEVQERQLERLRKQPPQPPPGHVDLSPKEVKLYDITKAIRSHIDPSDRRMREAAGLEFEVSNEIAKRTGRAARGFFVPMNMPVDLQAAARFNPKLMEDPIVRASVVGNIAGTSSLGGAGVQTTIVGFVDLLRARTKVVALGAQMLTGLTDTIAFVRQLTPNTLQWTGENPSTANTLSAATIEQFTMSPKTGMSSTAYSRQFLTQSSFDVNAFVMNDLTLVNAIGVDSAAINGSGTAQPVGLRSITNVTIQTIGANGAAAAWADVVGAETNVANQNADIGTMAWLTNPSVRGKWKTTLKSTTAGSLYLWSDEQTVNGYRAEVSTSIPNNLTQGTSTTICSIAVFGVWSEMLIGEWGGAMDVVVDPYTYVQQNMVQIVTALMVDVNVRHPKAFDIQIGLLTT